MKRIHYIFFLLLFSNNLFAQIVNNEGFENGYPPTGWSVVTGSSGATWSRVTAGVFPSVSPHSGNWLIAFSSYSNPTGVQSVITPAYSLVTRGSNTPTVSFWMYRDPYLSTYGDYIEAFINTSATPSGATLLGTVFRYYGNSPSVTSSGAGWYQYSFNVPAGFNSGTNYFIIRATSQYGEDMHIDDVSWDTYPPACSGTPAPGNTLSTLSSVCNSSQNFTLSLQNTTSGSGVTYQWQSSANNATWTNISGATSATYTGTQSAATYYRCNVTCSSATTPSASVQITMFTSNTVPYLEGFDATGLPQCWTAAEGASGAPIHWVDATSDGTYGVSGAQTGSGFCDLDVYHAETAYNLYYVTTAGISLPAGNCKLFYYYFLGNGGYEGTTGASGSDPYPLSVQVSTNGGSSWTTIYNHSTSNSTFASSNSTSNWTQNVINLNSYSGQTIIFRFVGNSNYGFGTCNMALDEVAVKLNAPTAVNGARCGSGNATASVTSNTGVVTPAYKWYTVASGGTAIAGQTGATLSSYSISATTTFYVSEVVGGVESDRIPVTAAVNAAPSASITASASPLCYGFSTGSATVAGSTGATPYTYSWISAPIQTSATASNLPAGSYTATVKDANNCTATASVTLTQPAISTLTALTLNPISATICSGTNIKFVAAGTGLGTLTFQWYVYNGTSFVAMSDAGIYTGTATDTLTLTNATPAYNGSQYRCVITGTCGPVTTTAATLTVNAFPPTVSINSVLPGTTICQNTSVTYTTSITNGGSTPAYQWSLDGSPIIGATSSSYTNTTMTAGIHQVRVALTSNLACAFPVTVNSSNIIMTVNPNVTPTIAISNVNPGLTICAGTNTTFSSAITNGGSSPAYSWKKNGIQVATTPSYSSSTLVNGDVINCTLTSNVACRSSNTAVTANDVMVVNPIVTPSISITPSTNSICSGDPVSFISAITNGGTVPGYQWQVNGSNAGTGGATFATNTLNNNDVVTCILTSNATCVNPTSITSAGVPIAVIVRPLPALTITASPDSNICTGTLVTLNTIPVNGGTNPQYQWKLNGVNMTGATANTYSLSVLSSGDIISCEMTSNTACATPPLVNANDIKFNVTPTLPATVFISSDKGNIITPGDTVTFSSLLINAGTQPTYIWKKNGEPITGANGVNYIAGDLANNDLITLTVFSSSPCSNPDSSTSNSILIVYNTGVGTTKELIHDVKLYPNPNTGQFIVEAKLPEVTAEKAAGYEILDNIGRVISIGVLPVSGDVIKKEITLGKIPSGNYFIRITVSGARIIQKFVVQQ